MPVDVTSQIEIARPRAEVAAYAADLDNATAWYENIKSVVWRTEPSLAAGGGTRMFLRDRGEPAGFAKVAAPMVAAAMRRADRKDLERLRELLEAAA